MEENRMTIQQVLEETVKLLNMIAVPVQMIESVGRPISNAVNNLDLCITAMKQADAQAQKEEEKDGSNPDPE